MKILHARVPLIVLTLVALSGAHAQVVLTLPGAVNRAVTQGADVTTARVNLQKAQANLRAVRADPASIMTTLTQAEQDVTAQAAALDAAKLGAAQAAVTGYLQTFEAALRVTLSGAQVALSERQLKIAQARLAARVATALDVSRAQNALSSDRQDLVSARGQLPVLEATLARILNVAGGTDLKLSAPPAAPKLSATLAALQTGLDKRMPSLVQAQRGLEDGLRAAQTGVREAYRAALDAQARVSIAQAAARTAQQNLTQSQARLKAGTAAAVEVQQAQLGAQQAQLGVQQAQNTVWRALAALSAASGVDVTGLNVLTATGPVN
ncbi:TolC family protein (plasmid) [Deinococcus taeanensis]|uniref:TolC family protein n=1 Tax=Deinococcus taeanensis TaxID=2737050 RepID=UPI001CDCBEDB|nr:TolC family protein [Deinococcus taeanensis]UBV44890.1 TolC family protein [Deinococcus taeanensis]